MKGVLGGERLLRLLVVLGHLNPAAVPARSVGSPRRGRGWRVIVIPDELEAASPLQLAIHALPDSLRSSQNSLARPAYCSYALLETEAYFGKPATEDGNLGCKSSLLLAGI
jgi:hypothetical protein